MASRRIAIAGVLAGLLALVGCGSGSDEAQIKSTAMSYLTAFADGDGERACTYLTTEQQNETARRASVPETPEGCAATLDELSKVIPKDVAEGFRRVEIVEIAIDGTQASVTFEHAPGVATGFSKEGGRWLVSDLPYPTPE